MNSKQKNIIYIITVILITALTILILLNFPNYAKPASERNLPMTLKWILVFGIGSLIFIGIPAWIHKKYVNDYSTIKGVWFFALFGGITGIILGEGGNPVMLIPYTILMLIYAFFYKKFPWWKIATTSYLAGILIENVMNKSPLQSPTILWIAFFTYPYFATKIWENRKKIKIKNIFKDLKYTFLSSFALGILATYLSRNNISPPLIILGLALPFLIKMIYDLIRRK